MYSIVLETPGGKRILVRKIIAQQIIRKRGIFKNIWYTTNVF